MGAPLREAWVWLLIAFLLGLAIGYVVRQRPTRAQATADGAATGGATIGGTATTRIDAGGATTGDGRTTRIAALEASAPATVAVPVEKAVTKLHATPAPATPAPATPTPATKQPRIKTVTARSASRKSSAKAAVLDLAAAKATLGVTVKLDDLKLIEGIGPRIETLFKADGITSWRELSKANVERLQGVLDAAGPRYKVHNPGSWPRQAGLLADGKWADFKTLTDKLKGGR